MIDKFGNNFKQDGVEYDRQVQNFYQGVVFKDEELR